MCQATEIYHGFQELSSLESRFPGHLLELLVLLVEVVIPHTFSSGLAGQKCGDGLKVFRVQCIPVSRVNMEQQLK